MLKLLGAGCDLQGVALELAAREGLDAEGALFVLEGGRAVDGERHSQDDHQAGAGQAARALCHSIAQVPEGAQLDEGACARKGSSLGARRRLTESAILWVRLLHEPGWERRRSGVYRQHRCLMQACLQARDLKAG